MRSIGLAAALLMSNMSTAAAQAAHMDEGPTGVPDGPLRDHYVTLIAALEATYREAYASAESLFAFVQRAAPAHPVGPLLRAAAVHARMSDREDFAARPQFEGLLDTALKRARGWIDAHPGDAWGFCLLGHVYGYRAMWEGQSGSRWKALRFGLKAKGAYHDALRRDSACFDAYLGLGNYHYWKSARTEFINWTGLLVKDDKERGIAELKLALRRSHFGRAAAAASLIWIELDQKRYEAARARASAWQARYPEGKSFLWGQAHAEFLAGANDSALARFDSLQLRVSADPEQGYFNLIEIAFHRAQLQLRLHDTAGACALLDSIVHYPAGEEVRRRQKGRLREARDLSRPCAGIQRLSGPGRSP